MMYPAFDDRKYKKLVLFDVDGTLTPARRVRPLIFRSYTSVEHLFDRSLRLK